MFNRKNIMNKLFLILTVLSSFAFSQTKNKIITDDESGKPMAVGYCTREIFNDSSFSWWDSSYDFYEINSTYLDELKNLNSCDITVVMGTWCSDSEMEVPAFYKILDSINYPYDKVTLICVDRDKKTEGSELEGLKIELVPTFIFYKKEKEAGRIVEFPDESLEADIAHILSENFSN